MASAVGSVTGSFANGVRRFSRLFSHQVWAAPELVTMLPKPGFARTLTQGSGVSRSPSRTTTYSRPSRVKPPSPFSMTSAGGSTGASGGSSGRWPVMHERRHGKRRLRLRAVQLLRQLPAFAGENRTGDRIQENPLGFRHRVASEKEDPAGLPLPCAPGAALDELDELPLHLVAIARGVLVQDHGVRLQPLETPELLRHEDVPHERQVVRLGHADEDDREIAGDAVPPEARLSQRALFQQFPFGAQRRVGEEDAGAESLEELGLLDGDTQVPERDLRVRVGQRERAGGDAGVVILLRQGARGGLVRGDARREGEAGEGAGREPQPRPQAENRVEHGARGAGERAPVERDGIVGAAPASQESHPVGLPLDRGLHSPVDGQDVKGEERRVAARRAGGAAREGPCSLAPTRSR